MTPRRGRRALLTAAGALGLGGLGGCATPPQTRALDQHWPPGLPPRVRLDDTPFIAQQDYECGPAALAMLLQRAGRPVTPEQLKPQVYLPGRQGSLQLEMLVAARRHGLASHRLPPRLDALLAELAAGHPVLVFQNLSLPLAPVWHYAVAIGYERDTRTLWLHSGREAGMALPLEVFERTWSRADHWAMLALPPEQLPATLDADALASGLVALERLDAAAAQRGYAQALRRWPRHAVLLMGLGNSAYAQRRLDQAQDAYVRLTLAHPQLADGWNNLAQVALERGRRGEARAAIARAVALGGPREPAYRALQRRIQAGGS
ncbi:PA2778 family cysteine peptidase [Pelomonas sp. CA6]|uniref:PA2778 family cysteine peptidase n=1 Tax=Pelomonas sp. CA6 TaxID=2907999 RepID=UPI001F4BE939|nr:PA2778 family cysteine peptidase [Pelomonas sp. CA6]MCH7344051.1 PA2778 family cysteine peptidase [Pelomonas sp. CA6]